MMGFKTRRSAFSLIETVVATLILSGAVVALGGISTNVLRQSLLNRHYEAAASVIERQLTLIDAVGIDAFIEADQLDGIYDQAEPGYRWSVETEFKDVDDLYLVTMSVEWMEGTRPYRVTAQTMFDGANGLTLPTTEPQTPPKEGSPGPGGPS
jgi:Tfp pilus assembly protein PilV